MMCVTELIMAMTFLLYGHEFEAKNVGLSYVIQHNESHVVTVWIWHPEHIMYCAKPSVSH